MSEPLLLPVTEPKELATILDGSPLAIDRDSFMRFASGFPRKYFQETPRIEIVKHFLLYEALGRKPLISSLARLNDDWKLSLITRDRSGLFLRIVAALSCYELNVRSAEAFANADLMVLDVFRVSDPKSKLRNEQELQHFLRLLEDIVVGDRAVAPIMEALLRTSADLLGDRFEIRTDNDSHPTATRLQLKCHDHFGLLYLASLCILEEKCSIEMAYIRTVRDQVDDEFFLTFGGQKLDLEKQCQLREKLAEIPQRWSGG